jgi:hypothetical protein
VRRCRQGSVLVVDGTAVLYRRSDHGCQRNRGWGQRPRRRRPGDPGPTAMGHAGLRRSNHPGAGKPRPVLRGRRKSSPASCSRCPQPRPCTAAGSQWSTASSTQVSHRPRISTSGAGQALRRSGCLVEPAGQLGRWYSMCITPSRGSYVATCVSDTGADQVAQRPPVSASPFTVSRASRRTAPAGPFGREGCGRSPGHPCLRSRYRFSVGG